MSAGTHNRLLPASPWRLLRGGVLGINRRNAVYIFEHNPRARYPRVDNKILTKSVLHDRGIPTPETYGVVERHRDLRDLRRFIGDHQEFVVKPAYGTGGRGIVVILSHDHATFHTVSRHEFSCADLRYHLSSILAGLFSLGARPDCAIIEQRIVPHPLFERFVVQGTPDIRVIVYRGIPVMAMIRLPTSASRGRANLHQGAVGAGVDLQTARTTGGVWRNKAVNIHPDTGVSIVGTTIPFWQEALIFAMRLADALELGYLGVDLVLDARRGPLVLEANARPGLAVQIANRTGLQSRLDFVDAHAADSLTLSQRLQFMYRLTDAVALRESS